MVGGVSLLETELKSSSTLTLRLGMIGGTSMDRVGDKSSIAVESLVHCNNEQFLLFLASSDQGIAYLPLPPIYQVEHPNLVPVMPDIVHRTIGVYLVVPDLLSDLPRVRWVRDAVRNAASMFRGLHQD